MNLSGYMNAPTEPAFLALTDDMDYLMYHLHEPIIYSRKKISNRNESPHQCLFKLGDAEINKNQEYSNFFHTYCDGDRARYLSYRISVTSTPHLFNGVVIGWYSRKIYGTYRISSN